MNEPDVKFTKRWTVYLEQYRESARRTVKIPEAEAAVDK